MGESKLKTIIIFLALGLGALIVFGLVFVPFSTPDTASKLPWYFFAYAMGLTMIVLPCTLPLAFVIVPLSMGKGVGKGLSIAVAFGVGVALTLSLYGVLAAAIGKTFIDSTGASLETVKNWTYFIAGIFAYVFALGELGLVRFHMPTYSGAYPAFIQKQQDVIKAFLLGLFLGNIGVGCPHPATPLIFTEIATSANIFYGWTLFLVHAIGRVIPLILLSILGILGVNGLKWLVARKDKLERGTGWAMVFVAAFILVLGLFTHDWWVNSGQHTLWEEVTQEKYFLGVVADRLGTTAPHTHGLEEGNGLLGLPLGLGNWVLVILWVLPMWWYYSNKKKSLASLPEDVRKVEEVRLGGMFWNFFIVTLALGFIFIYYLPQRFLTQAQSDTHVMQGGTIMEGDQMHSSTSSTQAGSGQGEHIMEGGEMMVENEHAESEAHGEHGATLYHEENDVKEGPVINLNATPVPLLSLATTTLDFFVNQKPERTPITTSQLELEHTKLIHVIGVRSDLNEFFHIHPNPTVDPGHLTVAYAFQNPGLYKIWSEIKKDGVNHAFGHPEIDVRGEGATTSQRTPDLNARNIVVGDYQVLLAVDEPVAKGHEHEFSFDIHTSSGDEVALEDYLGAQMHLTLIKDNLKQFIHTHPEEGGHTHSSNPIQAVLAHGTEEIPGAMHDATGADEVINFHVLFPEAGLYKAFAQFRPKGISLPPDEALTSAFWIKVEESAPFRVNTEWLWKLILSVVAIAILSKWVKKYIEVKPVEIKK